MGNTPSKEPQGRPSHKLSKPRVTSFQTPALPSSSDLKRPSESVQDFLSIPYSATSTSNNAGVDDNDQDQQDSDKSTPLVAPKAQRRLSLFRSKSSQEPPDSRKSRRNTIIGSPILLSDGDAAQVFRANSVSTNHITEQSHRGQSTGENWPLVARSRASWAYDLSSYEAQQDFSLVQDLPRPLPRSQTLTSLSGSRFDDMSRRRASLYCQPQSAPISRSNSELSLHPPMRRRSLIQTPGVATRPHPGPSTARSTRSSLRHSHPPTPSLSRQPSTHFEESDSDLLSFAPPARSNCTQDEVSGLVTPKDIDYSITGAFKYGTLRITNGSPVLTPDPALYFSNNVEHAESSGKTQDYFAQKTESEENVKNEGDGSDSPVSESALQIPNTDAVEDPMSKFDAVGEEAAPSLFRSNPDARLGDQSTSKIQPSLGSTTQTHPPSPLMIQSRQAAVDDDLFEDDTEVSGPEVLDVRVDPSARGSTRQMIDSTQTSECVNRSDSGFVSNSKSDSSQSHSSLAKADSGYSSNVSLRSLRQGRTSTTREDNEGAEEKNRRNSTHSNQGSQRIQRGGPLGVLDVQVTSQGAGDEHQVDVVQSAKNPPTPSTNDVFPKQVSRIPSGSMDVRANPTIQGRMRRKPLHQQPTAIDTSQTLGSQELNSPKPLPLSPASVNSEGSSSSLSIANNSQKPGRLQRLLSLRSSSSSKQTYTVHETHSVDSKIPSIPKEVEAKLREHTGLYPMTNKRLALKSQMSKETLKTILSVGSLEYANDDELPSTSALFDQQDDTESSAVESEHVKGTPLKQTLASMQSNFKATAASIMPSKKSLVRKPLPIREKKKSAEDQLGNKDSLPLGMGLQNGLLVSSSLRSSPRRSLSMTSGQDHYMQMRTYSLTNRPTSIPDNTFSSRIKSEEGQLLSQQNTSPPASMLTRTSFRTPPPRSPSRPQGPVVPRTEELEAVSSLVSRSVSFASRQRFGHHGSVGGGQLDMSAFSSYQSHLGTLNPPSRHSSSHSQTHTSVHSRNSSDSSSRSDFETRASQMCGQHAGGAACKLLSSLDGSSRNQLYGGYMPHSAQQESTFGPQSQFGGLHGHWKNIENGRPMSGQLPWGAPPYVPRGHHRRNLSAGSQFNNNTHAGAIHPPYRILHSYNSPAYRNAPIWG